MRNGFFKLANVTPMVHPGDVAFNMQEIKKALKGIDADIVSFPELSLTGYSCADLFFMDDLINEVEKEIEDFLDNNTFKGVIVLGAPIKVDNSLYNTALVIQNDIILGIVPKTYLPNSDEFMEKRWFTPTYDFDSVLYANMEVPFGSLIFNDQKNNVKFGVEICYDIFAPISPSSIYSINGCNLIINISASTESLGKDDVRCSFVQAKSKECNCIYSYTSCGINESTSSVVFGGEKIVASNGKLLNRGKLFELETNIIETICDIDIVNNSRKTNVALRDSLEMFDSDFTNVYFSMTDNEYFIALDTLPFIPKNNIKEAFKTISKIQEVALYRRMLSTDSKTLVIGVSGGLDSTLALLVAVKAFKLLKKDLKDIIAVTMPGLGTTKRTKTNADTLMEKLGVTVKEISIKDATLSHFKDIGHDENDMNVTYENAQARIRTLILMDIANDNRGIVLGTGDMSEIALGWSTYNGDQMSMYNCNCNIPKTLVRFMVECYANYEFKNVKDTLLDVIATPISPELKKNQKTEDTVGKYEINDFILYNYLFNGYTVEKISYLLNKAFNVKPDDYIKNFFNRFYSQQFKRQASPDGVKVLDKSLDSKGGFVLPGDILRRIK